MDQSPVSESSQVQEKQPKAKPADSEWIDGADDWGDETSAELALGTDCENDDGTGSQTKNVPSPDEWCEGANSWGEGHADSVGDCEVPVIGCNGHGDGNADMETCPGSGVQLVELSPTDSEETRKSSGSGITDSSINEKEAKILEEKFQDMIVDDLDDKDEDTNKQTHNALAEIEPVGHCVPEDRPGPSSPGESALADLLRHRETPPTSSTSAAVPSTLNGLDRNANQDKTSFLRCYFVNVVEETDVAAGPGESYRHERDLLTEYSHREGLSLKYWEKDVYDR